VSSAASVVDEDGELGAGAARLVVPPTVVGVGARGVLGATAAASAAM
jgi:hypothetical protein